MINGGVDDGHLPSIEDNPSGGHGSELRPLDIPAIPGHNIAQTADHGILHSSPVALPVQCLDAADGGVDSHEIPLVH